MPFTETDALDALRKALTKPTTRPEGAFTTDELAEAVSLPIDRVRKGLKRMLAAGHLEVLRIPARALDGRILPLPAYRLVKPPKGRTRAA